MCKRRNSTNKENLYQIKFVKAWFEQCYNYDKKKYNTITYKYYFLVVICKR